MRTLIFGYGNYDRRDDGVAWHILRSLKKSLGLPFPDIIDDDFDSDGDILLVFQLQLMPELAESINEFDRVCFIDAHTGSVPEDVLMRSLNPTYISSPLTHHLTPESLLFITQTIYHKVPEAVLLSVRGYDFEFDQTLSTKTESLVPQAVSMISQWLANDE